MFFGQKALSFLFKAALGVYLFYLFLAFIVIPLSVPWVLSSQSAKLSKHPVKVRSVFLNPFLLRLNINGFAILDGNKQTLVGFDKFWVDLSFLRLFKKQINVESLGLDGLDLNLLELALLPIAGEPASYLSEVKPLSLAIVDSLVLKRGRVSFTDQSIKPNFKAVLSGMDLQVKVLSGLYRKY